MRTDSRTWNLVAAYLAACLAAAATVSLVIALLSATSSHSFADWIIGAVGIIVFGVIAGTFYVALAALLPALAVIIYAEGNNIHNKRYHVAAGGMIALLAAGLYALLVTSSIDGPAIPVFARLMFVAIFPGFVGGYVFWRVAQRGKSA